MTANDKQIGGKHYQTTIQHWDFAAANNYDYFQGAITKYLHRWREKGGIQDLEKAQHFLEKYIEVEKKKLPEKFTIQPLGDRLAHLPRTDCIQAAADLLYPTRGGYTHGYDPKKD